MAPIGEQTDTDKNLDPNKEEDESQNLWESILGEVHDTSTKKLPSNKNLLILGDNESGKTTLVSKLQSNEDPRKGAGMEYHYIDVKDDYREDHTRLGIWLLDGDPHHTALLRYALTDESVDHTTVLLVVSMATPWAVCECLDRWAAYLSEHIDRLKLPPERMRELEDRMMHHFQTYVEPDEGQTSRARQGQGEEQVLLPLGENTLTSNLGVPIVVVVTKSDAISTLEKEQDYREEHFDFLQMHIRKFCLRYGASLFYTSVKENKNCDLLYRYLVHRIYNLPFNMPALVVERDAIFIPSGWDNDNKISILHEGLTNINPEDSFESVIVKPVQRKMIQREADVIAEDEQVFLMKQQTLLSKAPLTSQASRDSPGRPAAGLQRAVSSPRSPATAGVTPPKKPGAPGAIDPMKAGNNEGVLANFFNSLLSKKTTGGPGAASPKGAADRASVSRDAKAELDRMTRAKTIASPATSQNHSAS